MIPVLGFCYDSQNSRKHLAYWLIIMDIVEDAEEELKGEVYRARTRRILSTGVSVPKQLGSVTSRPVDCSPARSFLNPLRVFRKGPFSRCG